MVIMRKILFFIGMWGLLAVISGLASFLASRCDHDDQVKRVTRANINKQGPITQKDINAYLRILPELAPVVKNGPEAARVYKRHKLRRNRFFYLFMKIPACADSRGGEPFKLGGMYPALHPTAPEIALVRQNWEAIAAAEDDFLRQSGFSRSGLDEPEK